MRWLYRFNVARELESGSKRCADGIGHAKRCLAIAAAFKQNCNGEQLFLIESSKGAFGKYFDQFDVPFLINENEELVLNDFQPTVILTDINYLESKRICWYQGWAPVINLAPRGITKYFTDITINDTSTIDVTLPLNHKKRHWYRGPQYAAIGEQFAEIRERIDRSGCCKPEKTIVLMMGGVDNINMTEFVLKDIKHGTESDIIINVIVGPFNKHLERLENLCLQMGRNVNMFVNPPDITEIISNSSLGIFSTGLTTYEALAIGVPSINIGVTSFHDLRGEELQKMGLIQYLGRYDQLKEGSILKAVTDLLNNNVSLEEMRKKGLMAIDGNGCKRIINIIERFLNIDCTKGSV